MSQLNFDVDDDKYRSHLFHESKQKLFNLIMDIHNQNIDYLKNYTQVIIQLLNKKSINKQNKIQIQKNIEKLITEWEDNNNHCYNVASHN